MFWNKAGLLVICCIKDCMAGVWNMLVMVFSCWDGLGLELLPTLKKSMRVESFINVIVTVLCFLLTSFIVIYLLHIELQVTLSFPYSPLIISLLGPNKVFCNFLNVEDAHHNTKNYLVEILHWAQPIQLFISDKGLGTSQM